MNQLSQSNRRMSRRTSREVQREVVLEATAERMRGAGNVAARWQKVRTRAKVSPTRIITDL